MVFIIKSVSWQSKGQLPDAIFCTSDPKAFVVMHALHDMGLRIPEDVAVIGVDNVSMSRHGRAAAFHNDAASVRYGYGGSQSLIRQIEYKDKYGELPKPQRMIMNSDLIVRRSTK